MQHPRPTNEDGKETRQGVGFGKLPLFEILGQTEHNCDTWALRAFLATATGLTDNATSSLWQFPFCQHGEKECAMRARPKYWMDGCGFQLAYSDGLNKKINQVTLRMIRRKRCAKAIPLATCRYHTYTNTSRFYLSTLISFIKGSQWEYFLFKGGMVSRHTCDVLVEFVLKASDQWLVHCCEAAQGEGCWVYSSGH